MPENISGYDVTPEITVQKPEHPGASMVVDLSLVTTPVMSDAPVGLKEAILSDDSAD